MALYPNWLILYFLQVIIPMLMLIVTALKILLKNGKVMLREQLGINIYNPKYSAKHVPQSAKPLDTPSTTPSTPISFIYLPTVPQNTPTTPKHISPHHLENTLLDTKSSSNPDIDHFPTSIPSFSHQCLLQAPPNTPTNTQKCTSPLHIVD